MATNECILLKHKNCNLLTNNYFKESNTIFLAEIVHELNNSFTFIDSTIQLMESHNPDLNNIEHWSQLSKDVKELSRMLHNFSIYSCTNPLNIARINLIDLITEVITDSTNITYQKKIDVNLILGEKPHNLTRYPCDSHLLRSALSRLTNWFISNVESGSQIQFKMPSGHDGYLTSADGSKYMKLQLSTNALHMSTENLKNIFGPVTLKGTLYTDLSMPIAYRIISAHNGGISITTSDQFTTLTVYLPLLTTASLYLVPKSE